MTTHAVLLYIASDRSTDVSPSLCIAGLPIAERVLRAARRAGYTRTIVFDPSGRVHARARRVDTEIDVFTSAAQWELAVSELPDSMAVTVVGPGTIVSPAFLQAALAVPIDPGELREVPAGGAWPHTGVLRMAAACAGNLHALVRDLRTHLARVGPLPSGEQISRGEARFIVRLRSARDRAAAEVTMRRAIFKATDAKIARFNRRISVPISIAVMRTPVTANHVSLVLMALGFYSGWLFSRGGYLTGVLAAFISLAASILDGCDGEIARLKYQESALGCWLETFGDYSYYLAIFAGLSVGAVRQTGSQAFFWLGGLGLTGTIVSFALLIFLRTRITAGRPETLHAVAKSRFQADPSWWSVIMWRISFVATRAAMPYGIMTLALVYLLPLIVVLAALGANVYWASLVLKLRDLLRTESDAAVAA